MGWQTGHPREGPNIEGPGDSPFLLPSGLHADHPAVSGRGGQIRGPDKNPEMSTARALSDGRISVRQTPAEEYGIPLYYITGSGTQWWTRQGILPGIQDPELRISDGANKVHHPTPSTPGFTFQRNLRCNS
jgi:hypothetical protein